MNNMFDRIHVSMIVDMIKMYDIGYASCEYDGGYDTCKYVGEYEHDGGYDTCEYDGGYDAE